MKRLIIVLLVTVAAIGNMSCEQTPQSNAGMKVDAETQEILRKINEAGAYKQPDLELKKDRKGNDKIVWHGLNDGKQEVFNVEPHTTFWQRLGVGFLSILPIESQL